MIKRVPHFDFTEISDGTTRTRGNRYKLLQDQYHYDL